MRKRFATTFVDDCKTSANLCCQHGPLCYGVTNPRLPPIPLPYSEDCLFIDVYTPANWPVGKSVGLPVMLWIQGGGYVQMYNPDYNGTGLIEAAHKDAIVVSFNYRVGPYGFLASAELEAERNLNIGLHDQRAAISWVNKNIAAFGGDPERITLFGTSVGGGSVLMQLLAYGGAAPQNETSVTWSAGIAAAAYTPSVYSVDDMTFHFDTLLDATNCSDLTCLRSLSIEQLQAANLAVPFTGERDAALFGYTPVIDGDLLPDRPLNLLEQGRFAKDKPLIIGNSEFEGTIFAPQANTTEEVDQFLRTQFPKLSNVTLVKLNALYSNTPTTYPGVTNAVSALFYRASQILTDASFLYPSHTFAKYLSAAGVSVHVFLDQIRDPVEVAIGFLVPHTWELQAVWGPQYATQYVALPGADSYNPGGVNAGSVSLVQAYWTSFARTVGNLNLYKQASAPVWEEFGSGRVLSLQTNATRMEQVDERWKEKSAVWDSFREEFGL
nr:lipase 1 [Quercus suber]